MNVRNLSFVIVLILVWIMGYYYYSPDRFVNSQEIEHVHQDVPVTENQKEEPAQALEPENLVQTIPQAPVENIEPQPVSREIKKKRKTRKEKKHAETRLEMTPIVIDQKPESSLQKSAPDAVNSNDQALGQIITIVSDLKKKDIGYYKMLSWHYPHLFNLTVNDQPLFTKKDKVITQGGPVAISKNESFIIRYNYEWHTPWGKKIGAKKVTFKANPDAQNLIVHFMSNWKDEERIIVDGAEKISAELLEEENPAI